MTTKQPTPPPEPRKRHPHHDPPPTKSFSGNSDDSMACIERISADIDKLKKLSSVGLCNVHSGASMASMFSVIASQMQPKTPSMQHHGERTREECYIIAKWEVSQFVEGILNLYHGEFTEECAKELSCCITAALLREAK